jgi:alcohol dehydrogenase class IV
VGNRALIITKNDKISKDLAQNMWYKLSRHGIQSTFITMNMNYPVYREVKEAVQLIHRTASTSLISIGDASVTDFSKLIRRVYSSLSTMDESQLVYSNPNEKVDLPLISILQTPSINHYLPTAMMIHKEEDILIGIATVPSNLAIFEADACRALPYLTPHISNAYLVSSLFDTIFTQTLFSSKSIESSSSFLSEVNFANADWDQLDR